MAIVFKLKSIVNENNPSDNGLFEYGSRNVSTGEFVKFPLYTTNDGTGRNNATTGVAQPGQAGHTFDNTRESYPFVAFKNLGYNTDPNVWVETEQAFEVEPNTPTNHFPMFGVFLHPGDPSLSPASPYEEAIIKMKVPVSGNLNYIHSAIQSPATVCGVNVGYRVLVATDDSKAAFDAATAYSSRVLVGRDNVNRTIKNVDTVTPITAGNVIYFIVDKGDDGNHGCDDTALDVEISLSTTQMARPMLIGSLVCSSTSATFSVAFAESGGTVELYKQGVAARVGVGTITQLANSFDGRAVISGLDLKSGGTYYAIAKASGQADSQQSSPIVIDGSSCFTASGTAVDDERVTKINTPVTYNLGTNDTFNCMGVKKFQLIAGTERNGTASLNEDTGVVTFTPALDFKGVATFRYRILCDGVELSQATDTIYVNGANIPVVTVVTKEGVPVTHDPSDDDTDVVCSGTITYEIVPNSAINGTAVMNSSFMVTFTPAPGFRGEAGYRRRILCDGIILDEEKVIVYVVGATAVDDIKTTQVNTPIRYDLKENDTVTCIPQNP